MMEKLPKEMCLATLECVVMPNGEVISNGKTIGWFKDLAQYLAVKGGEDHVHE